VKRAFVTGGSGFVGGRLIPALRARGVEVAALARSDSSATKVEILGATPVKGDLDDALALEAGMAGCDIVFHAAAHLDQFDPVEVHRNLPRWLARTAVSLTAWMKKPPLTRTAFALMAHEVTVDDSKARRELGYVGKKKLAEGLAEMAVASRATMTSALR